ncbi:MAG: hypothetical protein R2867_40635 [Caldilineaceae bacterium]
MRWPNRIKRHDPTITTDLANSPFPARAIYERLPEVCQALDPTRPYWPGSPYGGSSSGDPTQGDRHLGHLGMAGWRLIRSIPRMGRFVKANLACRRCPTAPPSTFLRRRQNRFLTAARWRITTRPKVVCGALRLIWPTTCARLPISMA